ncbi:membrane protein [Vibrio galatheae]|uniref:Membrane protein n=1 Tax=Vibrio galatheae TaxID=579748 RepID=A0A0F4NI59_9VIBR|nr:cold shock and DUF1294 domain-containing protein [Vibrio galatheae]KJY82807.1 membrane protein [Vibrio galatheae]
MSIQGTISQWDQSKGYGYISVDNQDTQVRFHISDLANVSQLPNVSERVVFRLGTDQNGVMRAVEVERPVVFNFSLAIAVWFCSTLVGSVVILDFPVIACVFYFAVSAVTYTVYAFDKHAMQIGSWRIPEITFHMLNLVGGWIGALFAQSFMHHKYSDIGFKFLFWTTLILNLLIYCWFNTDEGAEVLTQIIARYQMP